MADDGFHEFQLNGKQLVFLFMTGTVVAVVIFLCGVMVGRGVQTSRAALVAEGSAESLVDPTAEARPPVATPSAPSDGASPSSGETLTYPGRLEDSTPPPETLSEPIDPTREPRAVAEPRKPQASTPPPTAATPTASAVVPPAEAKPPAEGGAVAAEPPGKGFVVQVAAVRERREAETIARRLSAKGYPTFVTTPAGAARVFRVRVGKYPDRRQAEAIKTRLEKEEQFKPWITR
jgi:DedD protein